MLKKSIEWNEKVLLMLEDSLLEDGEIFGVEIGGSMHMYGRDDICDDDDDDAVDLEVQVLGGSY